MHLGHAFSALFVKKIAESLNAKFILRIDNLDKTRSKDIYINQIYEDLKWLGIDWEEPVLFQKDNIPLHKKAINKLQDNELIYNTKTQKKEHKQSSLNTNNNTFDPDGNLIFSKEIAEKFMKNNYDSTKKRLNTNQALKNINGDLFFRDLGPKYYFMNSIKANPLKWGDPILLNKDNTAGYNLSVVVDDSNQKITHVTRGEDLYETTHIQILLYRLFDLEIPKYCHHPIIKDKNGKKLSKSKNSISLKQLKSEGTNVSDIISLTKLDKYNDYFEKLNKNIISI
jgi:glutamyl-Q tRNA(Asp) synthetase